MRIARAAGFGLLGLLIAAPVHAQTTEPYTVNAKARQVEHLIGTQATTPDGAEVGAVENLLVRPDGSVAALVLEWSGAAGRGERRVVVPWSEAKLTNGAKQVVVDADRERLAGFPTYDNRAPDPAGVDRDVIPFR